MVFYIFVGLVVVVLGWLLARSGVMRAWVRGRSSDPYGAATRDQEAFGGATWRDDG